MLSQFKKTKFASGPYLWKDILLIDAEWRTSSSVNLSHNIWWRHQMETFSALLAPCSGNSPVPGSDAELWCFLWSAPEKPLWPLWRQCNVGPVGRRLFGALSLSEAMLIPKKLCKWYKFEIQKLYSRHYIWKCCVQIGGHFVWIVMCWYQMIFADGSTYDLKKTDLFNSYCVIKNEIMYDGNGRKAHTNRMSGHTVRYGIIH